jgi:chromosome segregation protein
MPVSLSRLRIAGFKSFADPVSVEVLPGLTGIIGPNGCGKSNVVEALRWAMGESNARTLRGGEMDDVIFAGTAGRSSRNIAEVVVSLDQPVSEEGFPPPFTEQAELQVIRRIERGVGSSYRVNGKEVRARDVQTLFADMASGARSSAMVSQGRVGALVSARPEERRSILEEAAGITGLHARRHEAELKLRAAEANLGRAEDLRVQLDTQLAGLKKQARQASRYRNLSGALRAAEAELLAVQRARTEAARTAAHQALDVARAAVQAAATAARAAQAEAEGGADSLPGLREREAETRTALERHRLAQEQIAAEEARARDAIAAAAARGQQIARDLLHAEQLQRDAGFAAERLSAEDATLAEADAAHPDRAAQADSALEEAMEAVRLAEAASHRATEEAAELNARGQALLQALTQVTQRARRLAQQLDQLRQDRARAEAQAIDPARLAGLEAEAEAAGLRLSACRTELELAEQGRAAAQNSSSAARQTATATDAARAKLAAECQALAEVLGVSDNERWPKMVDALRVPSGLEAALGAALGEELAAAADPEAARHWRDLQVVPASDVPAGSTKLIDQVEAPAALGRALSLLYLVEGDVSPDTQASLSPGQILVSREGAVWRWDGYCIRAGAPTAAAVRLQQRNRLDGLRRALAEANATAEAARAARQQAEQQEQAAVSAEQQARNARREAEQALERARGAHASLAAQATQAAARLAALDEQLSRLTPDAEAAAREQEDAEAAHAALPDLSLLRREVDEARGRLNAARATEASARTSQDVLARDATARARRRAAIANERTDWAERARDAGGRVTDLAARAAEAREEADSLAAIPAEIAARRAAGAEALAEAVADWGRDAGALRQASAEAEAAGKAARATSEALSAAREQAVRAEAGAEQADFAWGQVAERVLERLGVNPDLPDVDSGDDEAEERARRKLERLTRERDEMGPVNLRAEIECDEIEARMAALATEREEISTAIAKLRGAIGHLNREGRERLGEVFTQIDAHFQALFARMFGGGRAHLALVGSDDPLEAGLEIYAQPPGKKLSALSLLSGGEQALTALSLIFAVFRCNPAPVCVLDEVDAPLDDANVERFCLLLEDMVRETGTRFLVVTHHHLTMAKMDRLYGVTMQERGVSRVLSVDLQTAANMVDPPRLAAE